MSLALLAAEKERQFDSALAGRDLIGQAKGIIMERFAVDAVRAFELRAKMSQDTNTPLRVIAAGRRRTRTHQRDESLDRQRASCVRTASLQHLASGSSVIVQT